MFKRLNFYTLREVIPPVFLFTIAILGLELLGTDFYQLVGIIVDRKIPVKVVLEMLYLRIPNPKLNETIQTIEKDLSTPSR